MPRFVMALDQGTTSSRAILFDKSSAVAAVDQHEFQQHFPQPGWVEHDAEEIWQSQLRAARGALGKAGARGSDVAAIGITNQRETTVVWERASGKPTLPTSLVQELHTNPFLRVNSPEIRAHLGMEEASEAEVFAALRRMKDRF